MCKRPANISIMCNTPENLFVSSPKQFQNIDLSDCYREPLV